MTWWQRRPNKYVGLALAVLAVNVAAYYLGMAYLENEPVTLIHSLRFVVETFTTVGYGTDATWTNPVMELLVTGMMLTGVVLVFMALPLVVVPLFEEALSSSPPDRIENLSGHVVICGFTGRGETLAEELEAWDSEYALVVPDGERAQQLHDAGRRVIHGDPQNGADLARAGAERARAIVADDDDETNASIVLAAREIAPDTSIVAVAEDPDNARYLDYAGATSVLTPRHLLGQSLAEKVTASVGTELGDVVELGAELEIAELPVDEDSEIAGRRLADSGIRERSGANVIAAWQRGSFVSRPRADDVLDAGTILVAAGTADQLERLRALTSGDTDRRHGHVIVVGYGEVGRTVSGELAAADVPYTVVDREDLSGVDVIGDAAEETTLQAADVGAARAVVLTLPDDTTTAFATLVVRELSPDVEVVARADADRKLYLAGADYVLSLATVSGRMLASEVLDEEEIISPEKQVEIARVHGPAFAGQSLREADIRARTGCSVIAIQRNGELLTELGPDVVIQRDDELLVAGSDESVQSFAAISR